MFALLLAGVELFFLTVAAMCFGFVLQTVLTTPRIFITVEQCLHGAKVFCAPHPISKGLGVHRDVGGDSRDS